MSPFGVPCNTESLLKHVFEKRSGIQIIGQVYSALSESVVLLLAIVILICVIFIWCINTVFASKCCPM
jgi:hypothetical protein